MWRLTDCFILTSLALRRASSESLRSYLYAWIWACAPLWWVYRLTSMLGTGNATPKRRFE